jgi:hypothetical protein
MFGRMTMVCAGALLIAAAGCSFRLGNNLVQVGVKMDEQVVNDSMDKVAQRIENEMRRLGLQVATNQETNAVRLTSTTKAGQRFVVLLTRVQGPRGEQTNIHVDWDQASDRELWLQLLLVAGQTALARG